MDLFEGTCIACWVCYRSSPFLSICRCVATESMTTGWLNATEMILCAFIEEKGKKTKHHISVNHIKVMNDVAWNKWDSTGTMGSIHSSPIPHPHVTVTHNNVFNLFNFNSLIHVQIHGVKTCDYVHIVNELCKV